MMLADNSQCFVLLNATIEADLPIITVLLPAQSIEGSGETWPNGFRDAFRDELLPFGLL